MAVPGAVFEAMADGNPYPVKALISLCNNTLLGFTNMARIEAALRNLDLLVVHEHIKTPTAQLADFILPGDTWLERPLLYDTMTWASANAISDKASEPAGECRNVFDFWCDLARRMGHGDAFPWDSIEEFYDWRLQPSGMDWPFGFPSCPAVGSSSSIRAHCVSETQKKSDISQSTRRDSETRSNELGKPVIESGP